MSRGNNLRSKLGWLKARGYIRDFEVWSGAEGLRAEVITTDRVVRDWRAYAVGVFWLGVVAARVRHNVFDAEAEPFAVQANGGPDA